MPKAPPISRPALICIHLPWLPRLIQRQTQAAPGLLGTVLQQQRTGSGVVLHGRARGFETRIGWTLAKAKDTPLAIRDLGDIETDP